LALSSSSPHINWNQTYAASGEDCSIIQTSDGGYALASNRFIKTDSSGIVEWEKILDAKTAFQLSNGDYVLANSESLTQTDSMGNVVWHNS
jgi:hypothetical protein